MASDEEEAGRDQTVPRRSDELPLVADDLEPQLFDDWNTFLIRFPDGKEVTVVLAAEDIFG